MTSFVTATLTYRVQKWQLQKPKIFKVCFNFMFISEQNMHAWLSIPSRGKNNKLFVTVFNTVIVQVLFGYVEYNASLTRWEN